MNVFRETVEAGSLSGAGRKLRMPLATVSRRLSELEAHLGTRLLVRSTRSLALTEGGAAYLAASKRILEDVGEAERAAAGENRAPRGELVIAAPIVFGRLHVLPVALAFLADYPEVDVQLVLSDRPANLYEEHVDVAVRVGVLPDSSLVAKRVGTVRQVVCGSPTYLTRRGAPRTVEALARHDCVTFAALGGSSGSWSFAGPKGVRTVRVRSRLVVNTAEAALDAAVAGLGLTRLLSYQVAASLRSGALRVLLKPFEPAPVPVSLLFTGQRPMPAKLRAFLDFADARLASSLATR